MAAGGKAAAKFPYDSFALVAFCEARGHRITLERDRLPSSVTVQDLTRRMSRASRASRDLSLWLDEPGGLARSL